VFEQEGVRNKLILLNYLVDMEDIYYESGKPADEATLARREAAK